MTAKAGYEYLLAYKITVPIYDLTVQFVSRCISSRTRTADQMVQAARSGTQNIAEGAKEQSLKGYIKLAGIARASLEELLKDYLAFARQRRIPVWPAERVKREIGEIREIMITLLNQANFLLDKLIVSLKEKHKKEGGLTEKLYRERVAFRGY